MARQTAPARSPDTEVTRLFCTECGTRNSADSKYCKECGHRVNDGYRTMMLSIEDLQAVDNEQNQERLTKLLDMAFWHNQAGNLDAAVMACEAALMIHPDCTTAHSLLGSLCEKKGDDARAIEHFEAVVALNPDSAADAAKLDLLRRGVHVKAVAPPPAHLWLPPALVAMNWGKVGDKFRAASLPAVPVHLRRHLPWVGAGAVTLLLLAGGLALIHPSRTARPTAVVTRSAASFGPARPVAASVYGGAAATANSLPAPIVLPPGKPGQGGVVAVAPDPFGETLAPGVSTVPLLRPQPSPRGAAPRLPRPARGLSLPPLSLKAVPLPGEEGVAPAPVALPSGVSIPSVPQHTVVVSDLGGAQVPRVRTAALPSSPNSGGASGDLSSHIRISINDSPSDNSISISDHATPPARPAVGGGGEDGDAYQQAAISLQQQGDFRRARAAYQKAIRAYKSQIAGGHDAEAAGQGLAASQTGLQICEQSQP